MFYDCRKSNGRDRPGGFFCPPPPPYKIGSQNTPYKLVLTQEFGMENTSVNLCSPFYLCIMPSWSSELNLFVQSAHTENGSDNVSQCCCGTPRIESDLTTITFALQS